MDASQLKDIARAWSRETDAWVVKAASEHAGDYPPEVRAIIHDEALRRELISRRSNACESGDVSFEFSATEKGKQAVIDWRESGPRASAAWLGRRFVAGVATALVIAAVSAIFGLREGAISGAALYACYLAIERILWPKEQAAKRGSV